MMLLLLLPLLVCGLSPSLSLALPTSAPPRSAAPVLALPPSALDVLSERGSALLRASREFALSALSVSTARRNRELLTCYGAAAGLTGAEPSCSEMAAAAEGEEEEATPGPRRQGTGPETASLTSKTTISWDEPPPTSGPEASGPVQGPLAPVEGSPRGCARFVRLCEAARLSESACRDLVRERCDARRRACGTSLGRLNVYVGLLSRRTYSVECNSRSGVNPSPRHYFLFLCYQIRPTELYIAIFQKRPGSHTS
ncbi:uncharacterized protein LOC116944393 isoform X2 [Petromyzon marinus]|uniref:uncharacterized protein LOC116944393 isoform X2 n=1 Tax=Petromyzon marinus TaxID=7757 RepID=UPI003F717037